MVIIFTVCFLVVFMLFQLHIFFMFYWKGGSANAINLQQHKILCFVGSYLSLCIKCKESLVTLICSNTFTTPLHICSFSVLFSAATSYIYYICCIKRERGLCCTIYHTNITLWVGKLSLGREIENDERWGYKELYIHFRSCFLFN